MSGIIKKDEIAAINDNKVARERLGRLSKQQRIAKAKLICTLYEEGYTLESCCESVGVNVNTFLDWAKPTVDDYENLPELIKKEYKRRGFIQEIQTLYKEAQAGNNVNFKALMVRKGRQALQQLVDGMEYEEVTTEMQGTAKSRKKKADGESKDEDDSTGVKPVSIKRVRKFIAPNPTAVIFTLKNVDKEHFADESIIEHKGKIGIDRRRLQDMSFEELEREELELKQLLHGNGNFTPPANAATSLERKPGEDEEVEE